MPPVVRRTTGIPSARARRALAALFGWATPRQRAVDESRATRTFAAPSARAVRSRATASLGSRRPSSTSSTDGYSTTLPAPFGRKHPRPEGIFDGAAWPGMAELATFSLPTGAAPPPFSLPGVDGKTWSLAEFADATVLVVAFWCNHCPYVQAWEGRAIALQKEYQARGVRFVMINANDANEYPDDSFPRMKDRATAKGYPFPYLRDESQAVAHAYGALVTPHAFVFGTDRTLRFQGPIDDNHEHPMRVQHAYLAGAIDDALAGRPTSPNERAVRGCSIKWLS